MGGSLHFEAPTALQYFAALVADDATLSVIEAAVDSVRPAAEAKGIRLQVVLDPRAGPVSGDPAGSGEVS